MAYGSDVTEGLPHNLSNPGASRTFQMTGEAYDLSVNGQPFYIFSTDETPYRRQTAPYRKEQVDQTTEPGEQSLTGWWMRSQSSFHSGDGINYYDPAAGEEVAYRFSDSKGVDVWTKGEVTLLRNSTPIVYSPDALASNGRSNQFFNSIEWTDSGTKYEGILYADNFILAKVDEAGVVTNFQTLDPAVDDQVYAAANDGENAYYITNVVSGGGSKLTMYKKSLNLTSASSATQMLQENGIDVTNAVLEYTKERIVAAINDKIYEIAPTATTLPSAAYTHPSTTHVWSSITSSGPAIYVAGWNGLTSTIVKFTLSTAGVMPTLTSAITAAELPIGEQVYKIKYYLGYMVIGTNKGIRVADISETDGSITYGPLIVETTQPVFDFAVRDRFVWCASGTTDGNSGLIRIDLSAEIEPFIFSYANDLYSDELSSQFPTTACDFLGNTNRLLWVNAAGLANTITNKELTDNVATLTTGTAHGYSPGDIVFVSGVDATFDGTPTITGYKTIIGVPTTTTFTYATTAANVSSTAVSPVGAVLKGGTGYIESATELVPNGYLTTGRIRYNTLESKLFKLLTFRGSNVDGSVTVKSISPDNIEFNIGGFAEDAIIQELSISYPAGAQEYLSFKFILNRSVTDTSKGPLMNGYQIKSLPAIPRQRLVQYPLSCYDREKDKFGVISGYDGSAYDRLASLESVESLGDSIRIEDFRSGESYVGLIEEIQFINRTPPDKRFSGFGGILYVTIRSL